MDQLIRKGSFDEFLRSAKSKYLSYEIKKLKNLSRVKLRSEQSIYNIIIFMGLIVLASNFLVQYPVKYYGLQDILTYGAFSYPVAFLITDLGK